MGESRKSIYRTLSIVKGGNIKNLPRGILNKYNLEDSIEEKLRLRNIFFNKEKLEAENKMYSMVYEGPVLDLFGGGLSTERFFEMGLKVWSAEKNKELWLALRETSLGKNRLHPIYGELIEFLEKRYDSNDSAIERIKNYNHFKVVYLDFCGPFCKSVKETMVSLFKYQAYNDKIYQLKNKWDFLPNIDMNELGEWLFFVNINTCRTNQVGSAKFLFSKEFLSQVMPSLMSQFTKYFYTKMVYDKLYISGKNWMQFMGFQIKNKRRKRRR